MAVLIRDVSEADITAITAIYAVEVTDFVNTYEYDIPEAAEMLRRMQDIVARGFPYLVAEVDGEVAGYAYANTYRTRVAYQWTVENSVYVDARFQGQRVGTTLLQALIDACTARGYRQMVAVIGEPTNTASIKLHERFGFHLVGVFQGLGRKHGRWLDTVQMQRALGDGADSAPTNE
ncbi:GNAT family N-acetyltransferase [Stenotrophomonas sp. CFBP8980]|jgi:phosphinothricin acetyltransferase|uniref:GNAT family N-acetyltransferase n=1 Tax=Stenotrophomonas sp. CFBP8980 TaxID=3096523 RepID=UPI0005AF2D47|nr:GNAT family N-acetyltransferase [Stenotrophomonas sp. CFBP8980]KIP81370.1 phosphinothricin acetyltransferase [Stenotrophomonas maltophilia]MDY1032173.1 N-acetyltransferase family protein [Stenotrophomonas sp. CFBP8980]